MPERSTRRYSHGSAAIPSDPLDRAYWELYDRATIDHHHREGHESGLDQSQHLHLHCPPQAEPWAVESGFTQFRQANVTPAVRVDETITVMGYLPKEEPVGRTAGKEDSASFTAYLKTIT